MQLYNSYGEIEELSYCSLESFKEKEDVIKTVKDIMKKNDMALDISVKPRHLKMQCGAENKFGEKIIAGIRMDFNYDRKFNNVSLYFENKETGTIDRVALKDIDGYEYTNVPKVRAIAKDIYEKFGIADKDSYALIKNTFLVSQTNKKANAKEMWAIFNEFKGLKDIKNVRYKDNMILGRVVKTNNDFIAFITEEGKGKRVEVNGFLMDYDNFIKSEKECPDDAMTFLEVADHLGFNDTKYGEDEKFKEIFKTGDISALSQARERTKYDTLDVSQSSERTKYDTHDVSQSCERTKYEYTARVQLF